MSSDPVTASEYGPLFNGLRHDAPPVGGPGWTRALVQAQGG